MRIVNLRAPQTQDPRITILSYGGTRSGKTRFAASFPRPLFLSDVTESGWTTIQTMDPNDFYEPERDPIAWGIESIADMADASVKVDDLIARGEVKTIIVDSLTFYADLYFTQLLQLQGSRQDTRRAYGDLNNHLRDLRVRFHMKKVNVIWLALDKQPDTENPVGGPLIPGQQATKFAAGCDFIFFHRQIQEGNQLPRWEMRTKRFGPYIAGGRDGGILNDPLEYPTYRKLADGLKGIEQVFEAAEPDQVIAPPAAAPIARPAVAQAKPIAAPAPVKRIAPSGTR